MKRSKLIQLCFNLVIAAAVAFSGFPLRTAAASQGIALPPISPQPYAVTSWCAAGSFQGWDNASTPLYDDGTHGDLVPLDGVYSREVTIASAGRYEFKAVACGDWSTAYPPNNAWFITSADGQKVTLTFDTNDRGADAGLVMLPSAMAVNVIGDTPPTTYTAIGDFQGWNNADPNTALEDLGRGFYRLLLTIPNAGNYMGKITQTGSWGEQFTAHGRSTDGGNINFTTTSDDQVVAFLLDVNQGKIAIAPSMSGDQSWCAAGDFQDPPWSEAATPLLDDGLNGDLWGGDGVYSRDVIVAAPGRYEWKVNACSWATNYPGNNAWFVTTAPDQVVKLIFDTNNHANDAGLPYFENQFILNAWDSTPSLTVAGSFQGWSNDNPATTLSHHGPLDALAVEVSPGAAEFKFVRTGSWDSFGPNGREKDTANHQFNTTMPGTVVHFVYNPFSGRTAIYVPPQTAQQDDNIWWNDLGHNSRDGQFRAPGGAVTTNTPVYLRLRAARGDLTAAQLRLYNDRTNVESLLPMTIAASDDRYDWWQVQAPASPVPTVYWYRFIAIDGSATAYYEDDSQRTGGWGQTFGTSPDNSWQLTIYDPGYQTPDWVKNAIIYQIFPDRFFDGDPSNNTPTGSFFYDESGGTITRSLDPNGYWNTVVCDPRAAGDCAGSYSKNFYGGDLIGITAKLDYLHDLGVTAIYLNPIFESPSNHKYDTTDFLKIDDNFGTLEDFQTLAAEAQARGMHIILDGVFNHTSSDSIYFDRYHRYDSAGNPTTIGLDDNSGACEGSTSPYYLDNWFYFPAFSSAGQDNGVLATCNNGPGDAPQSYEAWFGYSSLPKLQANSAPVRDLIWNTPGGVARYWLEQGASGWRLDVAGDVDPGVINDPNNDYWEGFRQAVLAVDPEAYIVGEEWGNATSWLLGGEWDATMNYQVSSAILSFWRDTVFIDNDHNSGSSAGELRPLNPQELDNRLHNLVERYPPQALYAMMNLLGSHDTNRPLFMLDENTSANDPTLYQDPDYDWSDAINRLKGVVLLQMTLPGAPTIYYGDEVGLVGPPAFDGSTWQDDPYNRQPFPWLDQPGTPFYAHLQSQASQDALRSYYQRLTTARNNHPALRTGSFDTLKTDNDLGVYAFGRLAPDYSDAAVVIANRKTQAQVVTLDLDGYLPYGAVFTDVLGAAGNSVSVSASGELSVPVPAMSGALLVYSGGANLTPPPAPTNLAVTHEGNQTISLAWDAAAGADTYLVERSLVSGGGFAQVGDTAATTFDDSGLQNAQETFYQVRARSSNTGLVSAPSNEASGMPHLDIGWAGNMTPLEITRMLSATPSEPVYVQVWIDGETPAPGPTPTLLAQLGFGAVGSDPADWTTWQDAVFDANVGNNDQFMATLMPESVGEFDYTYRFTTTNGRDWMILGERGKITLTPPDDTTAPQPPTALSLLDFGRSFITIGWTPPADSDLYAYDIYRSLSPGSGFSKVGRVLAGTNQFTDSSVATGETYFYYVLAIDTSFNHSTPSNELEATAQAKMVQVTLNVTVPDVSPGTVYFSRNINPNHTLGDWNPSGTALSDAGGNLRTTTFTLEEGVRVEFKFTRGSWDTVEKDAAGQEISNRVFTVTYGPGGTQVVDLAVESWRDPLVVAFTPPDGTLQDEAPTITFTWSKPIPAGSALAGVLTTGNKVVPGSLDYDDATRTVTFTPTVPLPSGRMYTFTVSGQAAGGDTQQVPVSWRFGITPFKLWMMINFPTP